MNYTELTQRAYENACNKGFHNTELSDEHCLALIISELSEALEADRKNKYTSDTMTEAYQCAWGDYMDSEMFERFIKGTFQEEIADTCIRIFDFCGLKGINVIIPQEMEDNALGDLKSMSTAEMIFTIQRIICSDDYLMVKMNLAFAHLVAVSKIKGFDLKFFIEEKMKYNETREYKHGKAY